MWDIKTTKSLLGFDELFQDLERFSKEMTDNYPPHNVYADSKTNPTTYTIELAVSGFTKDDIEVNLDEDKGKSLLKIESRGRTESIATAAQEPHYIVRGIASRAFKKHFTLSKELEVESVKLENGLLTITMKLVKPVKSATKSFTIS